MRPVIFNNGRKTKAWIVSTFTDLASPVAMMATTLFIDLLRVILLLRHSHLCVPFIESYTQSTGVGEIRSFILNCFFII